MTRGQMIMNWILYGIVALVGVVLSFSLQSISSELRTPNTPIEIQSGLIAPENADVCAGDDLRWPLTITYNEGSLLMEVYRHVRSLDTGRLILSMSTHLTVPQEEAGVFDRGASWSVPDLPPGRYRLITSTHDVRGSKVLQYSVDFTIRSDCE